jgi:hypothetical protein
LTARDPQRDSQKMQKSGHKESIWAGVRRYCRGYAGKRSGWAFDLRLRRCVLKKQVSFVAISLLVVALARVGAFSSLLSTNYLPHRFCYMAQPGLIWTNVSMDLLIAAAYGVIFGCLFWIMGKLRSFAELKAYSWIVVSFGTFILACGVTHAMEVVTV